MEKVLGLGGVFIRAKNPVILSDWYRDKLGVDSPNQQVWHQSAGPCVFAPFPEKSEEFSAKKQWMLNFRVADLDAMVAQLREHGVDVAINDEEDPTLGRFARLTDPEDNPIELWEPPAA